MYKDIIGPEKEHSIKAIVQELDSLRKNITWIIVNKPKGVSCVGCKWIFKKKVEVGEKESIMYKSRLVAKGFTQ